MQRRISPNTVILNICLTTSLSACTKTTNQTVKEALPFKALPFNTQQSSVELIDSETVVQAENKRWTAHSQAEVKNWSSKTQTETQSWEKTESSPRYPFQHVFTTQQDIDRQGINRQDNRLSWNTWLIAKSQAIQVNSLVCTYSDNKYGRVTKISELNLELELIGQAKIVRDGVFFDLSQGALFDDKIKPFISLIPLQGFQSFSVLQVAACQPQGSIN